jgi:hypothetical protein
MPFEFNTAPGNRRTLTREAQISIGIDHSTGIYMDDSSKPRQFGGSLSAMKDFRATLDDAIAAAEALPEEDLGVSHTERCALYVGCARR